MLVGINLLREGLDMPEVSLVAVLDADKEGFLRSERSLIQTAGRAARNVEGLVILYADTVTGSMKRAMAETERRRKRQMEYNRKHGITPETVIKGVEDRLSSIYDREQSLAAVVAESRAGYGGGKKVKDVEKEIRRLEKEMKAAAKVLEFELAAELRDRIEELRKGTG